MAGRSNGLCFLAGLNQPLSRLGMDATVVLGLEGSFLFVVGLSGVFEDVDEMFPLFVN